jgi:hypothetical protein
MTELQDHIDARWGDGPWNYVSPADREQSDARLRSMWKGFGLVTGTDVPPPRVVEVHTPRGMPATLTLGSSESRLIWDAGLGTLLTSLSFPVLSPQPSPVVEAILRDVLAIRNVIGGRPAEATAEVLRAQELLQKVPIDRSHQVAADPESQFEVWLLTEMQERFALGHELAHYMQKVDSTHFDRWSSLIGELVESLVTADPPGHSVLSSVWDDSEFRSPTGLTEMGFDPYAWYLRGSEEDLSQQHPTKWRVTVVDVHRAVNHSTWLRDEVVCDVLSALTLCLDAHLRQRGWTAPMAVSCSGLALANLGVLMGADRKVSGGSQSVWPPPADIGLRLKCLNLILPHLLPITIKEHAGGELAVDDVDAVLRLAAKMHDDRLLSVLPSLARLRVPFGKPRMTNDEILIRAHFFFARPSADWRTAQHAARQSSFRHGN